VPSALGREGLRMGPALDLGVVATTFVPLLLLELPDKTFIATLVLSTRYRPLTAWLGVGLAFGVQCVVAVTAGGLLSRLPTAPVAAGAAVLFAVGAVILWRGAAGADDEEAETESELAGRIRGGAAGLRAVGACFLVVFIAEWGDLSQLFTAGLAARFGDPVSVFVGAWAALLVVSGLAALLGRALLTKLKLATIRRAGAVVCAVLALVTGAEAAGLL
jgi:putative Ca2+/H+ antiporter (TMEM165/GDT1 family)